jgi:hypothetical protein
MAEPFVSLEDPFNTTGTDRNRLLPNGTCHGVADGWERDGKPVRTWISLFFRVRLARFGRTITFVFRSFQWPILRTGPAADRTRRPFQCDRYRSVVFAPERPAGFSFCRVGTSKSMWTNVNFAYFSRNSWMVECLISFLRLALFPVYCDRRRSRPRTRGRIRFQWWTNAWMNGPRTERAEAGNRITPLFRTFSK